MMIHFSYLTSSNDALLSVYLSSIAVCFVQNDVVDS